MNRTTKLVLTGAVVMVLPLAQVACTDDDNGTPGLLASCSGGGCSEGQTCSGSSGACMESCTCVKAGTACTTTSCASSGATMCAPRKCGSKETSYCTKVCDPNKHGKDCPNHAGGVYCKPVPFTATKGVVRYVCMPLCPGETPPDAGVDGTPDKTTTVDTGSDTKVDQAAVPDKAAAPDKAAPDQAATPDKAVVPDKAAPDAATGSQ